MAEMRPSVSRSSIRSSRFTAAGNKSRGQMDKHLAKCHRFGVVAMVVRSKKWGGGGGGGGE